MASTTLDRSQIDWQKLLAEIKATGISDYKIAQCCDIQQTQLDRILNGSEPKYRVGILLIGLHEVMTGQKSDMVFHVKR